MVGGSFKAAAASTATFDNYASSDSTVLTYPVTVGSHSNRALAVFVHISNNDYAGFDVPAVNSVTYAGVPLTRIVHQVHTDGGTIGELWALPAEPSPRPARITSPSRSTISCQRTFAAAVPLLSIAGRSPPIDVDQTTTFTSTAGNVGTSTAATLTLPSSGANDLVVDSICNGTSITSTTETAQWINNHDSGNTCDTEGGATAAGGTTSLSWTGANDEWVMVGGSFKAAAASTATFDSYGYDRSYVTSYPLTVGSQSNRALAVFVNIGTQGSAPLTVSGVTYAGVALTQIVHKVGTDGDSIGDLWALPAEPSPRAARTPSPSR